MTSKSFSKTVVERFSSKADFACLPCARHGTRAHCKPQGFNKGRSRNRKGVNHDRVARRRHPGSRKIRHSSRHGGSGHWVEVRRRRKHRPDSFRRGRHGGLHRRERPPRTRQGPTKRDIPSARELMEINGAKYWPPMRTTSSSRTRTPSSTSPPCWSREKTAPSQMSIYVHIAKTLYATYLDVLRFPDPDQNRERVYPRRVDRFFISLLGS